MDPTFKDKRVFYTLHSNGYIRRRVRYTEKTTSGWYKHSRKQNIYQLNRTEFNYNPWPSKDSNGNPIIRFNKTKARIMATPYEQLGILFSAVNNYRNKK
jgi:hypothetical protein